MFFCPFQEVDDEDEDGEEDRDSDSSDSESSDSSDEGKSNQCISPVCIKWLKCTCTQYSFKPLHT